MQQTSEVVSGDAEAFGAGNSLVGTQPVFTSAEQTSESVHLRQDVQANQITEFYKITNAAIILSLNVCPDRGQIPGVHEV